MTVTRITTENALDFPIGTRVRFFNGCPVSTGGGDWPEGALQVEDALIVGLAARPATKHFPEVVELVAETEAGFVRHIAQFTTVGIGAYLIDERAST